MALLTPPTGNWDVVKGRSVWFVVVLLEETQTKILSDLEGIRIV